jgi:hypothetical protein
MEVQAGPSDFWHRFGAVTGRCGHAPLPKPRQKIKISGSEWPHYFLKCSNLQLCLWHEGDELGNQSQAPLRGFWSCALFIFVSQSTHAPAGSSINDVTPQVASHLFSNLERFKKYCGHPVKWRFKPGLLIFGFVSAQLQGAADMLLCQSLAKSPSRTGHQFPAPSCHNIF